MEGGLSEFMSSNPTRSLLSNHIRNNSTNHNRRIAMETRYRATIYVDLWSDSPEKASRELAKLIKSIPNSFTDGLSELKHGSEVSLNTDN